MDKYQHTLEKLANATTKRSITLVLEGALIGVLAGLTAVLYRYCLTYAESGLYAVLNFIRGNAGVTALWRGIGKELQEPVRRHLLSKVRKK